MWPARSMHARRALDLVGENDHVARGAAAALLGLAHWTSADLDAAHRYYADAMASMERAGHLSDVIGCAVALAEIRIAQGRLGEAMSTYARALSLATDRDGPALRGVADLHVGMSQLLRERNDLDAAKQHLQASRELGELGGLPRSRHRWCVSTAEIMKAEGDLGRAIELLDEADRLYVSDFFPDVRPISALRARVRVAQGAWVEALAWAGERGLSVDDDLSYLRECEHITLARALLARGAIEPRCWRPRRGDPALGAARARGRGWSEDGQRSRDLGAPSASPPSSTGDRACACIARARGGAGRARGLRTAVRGRGSADGLPAASGHRAGDRAELRPLGCWRRRARPTAMVPRSTTA